MAAANNLFSGHQITSDNPSCFNQNSGHRPSPPATSRTSRSPPTIREARTRSVENNQFSGRRSPRTNQSHRLPPPVFDLLSHRWSTSHPVGSSSGHLQQQPKTKGTYLLSVDCFTLYLDLLEDLEQFCQNRDRCNNDNIPGGLQRYVCHRWPTGKKKEIDSEVEAPAIYQQGW